MVACNKKLQPRKKAECLIYFDEKTKKKIQKALQSTKWKYLRITHFGNGSAGTDMTDKEKFLIVYGNWYSGEYRRFQSYLYPDRKNNYRLAVAGKENRRMMEELQILLMREFMEYPLRSRRKIPTFCITDYFVEKNEILKKINVEILDDYNVSVLFF